MMAQAEKFPLGWPTVTAGVSILSILIAVFVASMQNCRSTHAVAQDISLTEHEVRLRSMENTIKSFDTRVEAKFEKIETKFDRIESKIDAISDHVSNQ